MRNSGWEVRKGLASHHCGLMVKDCLLSTIRSNSAICMDFIKLVLYILELLVRREIGTNVLKTHLVVLAQLEADPFWHVWTIVVQPKTMTPLLEVWSG